MYHHSLSRSWFVRQLALPLPSAGLLLFPHSTLSWGSAVCMVAMQGSKRRRGGRAGVIVCNLWWPSGAGHSQGLDGIAAFVKRASSICRYLDEGKWRPLLCRQNATLTRSLAKLRRCPLLPGGLWQVAPSGRQAAAAWAPGT